MGFETGATDCFLQNTDLGWVLRLVRVTLIFQCADLERDIQIFSDSNKEVAKRHAYNFLATFGHLLGAHSCISRGVIICS